MGYFSKNELKWASLWGIVLCLLQISVCVLLASRLSGFSAAYLRLNQWDSFHYLDIIDRGYQLPPGILHPSDVHENRSNVGFFPGYPMAVTLIKSGFRFSTPVSMLITAQLACLLFWIQLLLLLRHWGLSRKIALKYAGLIAVFPASFFLVTGYSESLFVAALMGLIYWLEIWLDRTKGRKVDLAWWMAALNGFILSGTRLVGIPLMIYPIARVFLTQRRDFSFKKILLESRTQFRVILLSFVTFLGGFLFFIYCQIKFGQWNLYFKLQRLGWGNEPNYLAIINPISYIPKLFFEDTSNSVSRASNLVILMFIWISIKGEKSLINLRAGLYFAVMGIFFISLSGKANYNMDSMVRYNLPVFLLFILSFAQKRVRIDQMKYSRFLFFLALAFQLWMILVFTKGGWVA